MNWEPFEGDPGTWRPCTQWSRPCGPSALDPSLVQPRCTQSPAHTCLSKKDKQVKTTITHAVKFPSDIPHPSPPATISWYTHWARKCYFRVLSLTTTLQRHNTENSKQIFPEKELRRLSPNFHDRSAYSATGKYVSLEYINRSQTHECGNEDWGHAIPFLRICKWDFHCSVYF